MTISVGLDKRGVGWGQGTGVRRYRDRLRRCIEARAECFAPHLLTDDRSAAPSATRVGPRFFAGAARRHRLLRAVRQTRMEAPLDLFHWSHPVPLWAEDCLNVVSIHDLIPLTRPEHSAVPPRRFARLLRQLVDRGACFTCVSEQTQADLLAATGIDPARSVCTYQAVEAPDGKAIEGLAPRSYFLLLGRVEPRKNVLRAVEAWRMAGTGLRLVVAGPDGHWPDRRARASFERAMADPGILRLPWLDDDHADRLIANARALVMPSLAEGFGLPPVEAMAAGVPAIASASAISCEILGDAARLVDPLDTAAIAQAMRELVADHGLADRLAQAGIMRARRYDEAAFAGRLRLAYDQFLGLSGRS